MMDNANLKIENCYALSSDGPNVNKKVFRLINENKKGTNSSLLDLGSCNIHIIHNAFLKGVESFYPELQIFLVSIVYFFKDWPTRSFDYETVQLLKKVPKHHFIKHISTRWLTMGPAVIRVLEQLPAIQHYFNVYLPKNKPELLKNKHSKIIRDCVNEPDFKTRLLFIKEIVNIFTNFTKKFQKEEPLIHIIYDELKTLVLLLSSKTLVDTKSIDFQNINTSQIFESSNILENNKIDCGPETKEELKTLETKYQIVFCNNVKSFFKNSVTHILNKSSISNPHLKYFKCLNPEKFLILSDRFILKLCELFTNKNANLKIDSSAVVFQWNLLKLNKLENADSSGRVDTFWSGLNKDKYKDLLEVCQLSLILSHGNADVERGFSLSGKTLTNDRTKMSFKMLNARLNVESCTKGADLNKIVITKELMILTRTSHNSYLNYLENEKEKRKKENDVELKNSEAELVSRTKILQTTSELEVLDKQMNDKFLENKKNRELTSKLIEETNVKLKLAISEKDFTNVEIAQGMLEHLIRVKDKNEAESKETEKISSTFKRKALNMAQNISKKSKK